MIRKGDIKFQLKRNQNSSQQQHRPGAKNDRPMDRSKQREA